MTSASNSTAAARQVPPLTADLADDLAKRAPIDLHAREETAAFPPPLADPATCDESARYTTPSPLASSSHIDLRSQPPTLPAALVRNLPVLRITQGTWMSVPDLARFTRPWALPSALVNALPVLRSAWIGSRGSPSSPAPAPPAQAQEQAILPILNILPAPVMPATTSLLSNLTRGWNMGLNLASCVTSVCLARLSTHTGTLAFAQGSGQPADQIPAWPALDAPSVQVIFASNLSSPLQHINHSCNPNCRLTANLQNNTFVLDVIRDVEAGSELTIDYSVSGAYKLTFRCKCGNKSCSDKLRVRSPATTWSDPDIRSAQAAHQPLLRKPADPVADPAQLLFQARTCQNPGASDLRNKVCAGTLPVHLSACNPGEATLPILSCLKAVVTQSVNHSNETIKAQCVTGDLMDSWLLLWASELGCSTNLQNGWHAESPIWIAQTQLYSRLVDSGYCLHSVLRSLDITHMTATDKSGAFIKTTLLFPVFVSPACAEGIGHWYYICLKTNGEVIEYGDSTHVNREYAAAQIGRLWDDICTLTLGYNFNAQRWQCKAVDRGTQHGLWECGFYALHGITSECAGVHASLTPTGIDSMKQLIAGDLNAGRIVVQVGLSPSSSQPSSPAPLTVESLPVALMFTELSRSPSPPAQLVSPAREDSGSPPCDPESPERLALPSTLVALVSPVHEAPCSPRLDSAPQDDQCSPPYNPASPERSVSPRSLWEASVSPRLRALTSSPASPAPKARLTRVRPRLRRDERYRFRHHSWARIRKRTALHATVYRRKAAASKRAHKVPKPEPPVDCPTQEHVLLDGDEGLPMQVLTLNLGISGIRGSLQELASLLQQPHYRNIAVLHLQEARLKKLQIAKLRQTVDKTLPKYAMYVHCQSLGDKPTTAVITLVRKELTKWISVLEVCSTRAALSG